MRTTDTFSILLCRAVGRVAVVDLDAHLATGTADILCRTLDPAFLYASIALPGEPCCIRASSPALHHTV